MYYGSFDLVNYSKGAYRPLTDYDHLEYKPFVFLKHEMSRRDVADAMYHGCMSAYQSIWRLGSVSRVDSGMYLKLPTFDSLPGLTRRAQGVWLDKILPGYCDVPKLWNSNFNKIVADQRAGRALDQLLGLRSMVPLAITVPRTQELTPHVFRILCAMWDRLKLPSAAHATTAFRFFVFSSSVPGTTTREKAEYLRGLKHATSRLVLIADDLPLSQANKLGAALKMPISINVSDQALTKNKRLLVKDKAFLDLLETWRPHPGSSPYTPILFTNEVLNAKQQTKLFKHYTQKAHILAF